MYWTILRKLWKLKKMFQYMGKSTDFGPRIIFRCPQDSLCVSSLPVCGKISFLREVITHQQPPVFPSL